MHLSRGSAESPAPRPWGASLRQRFAAMTPSSYRSDYQQCTGESCRSVGCRRLTWSIAVRGLAPFTCLGCGSPGSGKTTDTVDILKFNASYWNHAESKARENLSLLKPVSWRTLVPPRASSAVRETLAACNRLATRTIQQGAMFVLKKDRIAVYTYLFNEGVIVAEKDYYKAKVACATTTPEKTTRGSLEDNSLVSSVVSQNHLQHSDELDVHNNVVIQLLKGLHSMGPPPDPNEKNAEVRRYVKQTYAWRHYYWYLTDEGLDYLRSYLHIPADVVPKTRQNRAARPARPERPGGEGGFRDKRVDGGFGAPEYGDERGERRAFGRGGGGFRRDGFRGGDGRCHGLELCLGEKAADQQSHRSLVAQSDAVLPRAHLASCRAKSLTSLRQRETTRQSKARLG
eukprot:scaffold1289_cov274-Pinguiococcus_pyrenoidosus.AAC.16